jgi:serine/threonine protein kinase
MVTPDTVSHYRILSSIATGGMGEVFLAHDTILERNVALKILPTELISDKEAMARFYREAKAAASLNHPNICAIYEVGETHLGCPFIAMEYLEGQTLNKKINGKSLDLLIVLGIANEIVEALAQAHLNNIIHRDIKPSNVMINNKYHVTLFDFGLAKIYPISRPKIPSDSPTVLHTRVGIVMGTVQYMSPEQASGSETDCRTDIFSMGVLIYEMATGRLPFPGTSRTEIINNIIHSQPEPPSRLNADVPPELERIIFKCLEKEPDRRYQHASDLSVDLRNLIRDYKSESNKSIGFVNHRTWQSIVAITILTIVVVIGAGLYLRWKSGQDTAKDGKPIESIAVLPFINDSDSLDMKYLSAFITESLSNNLSQLPNLKKVIAYNSVSQYMLKQSSNSPPDNQRIARDLNVRALLTGRVYQRGDSLTISVALVDTQDNRIVWGDLYNKKLADVFVIQAEISRVVTEKLRLRLTEEQSRQISEHSTKSIKAAQLYEHGQSFVHLATRENLFDAIRYYKYAIEADKTYARPYVGLAEAYASLGLRGYQDPSKSRDETAEAAGTAIFLDKDLPEAHVAVALADMEFAPYDFTNSDRELKRAIELSPNLAIAHQHLGISLIKQGRLDEGLMEALKARELDPYSAVIAKNVSLCYEVMRQYNEAIKSLRQAKDLGPPLSSTFEIGIYIQNGQYDEARNELLEQKRGRENDPLLVYGTGMIYAAQDDRARALNVIKELEGMPGMNFSQEHWIAKIYATLGQKDEAIAALERGLKTGAVGAFYKDEPVWDKIRNDARFTSLLRRMRIEISTKNDRAGELDAQATARRMPDALPAPRSRSDRA